MAYFFLFLAYDLNYKYVKYLFPSFLAMRTPFELRFITDSYEVTAAAAGPEASTGTMKGFELNYVMSC